MPATAWAVLLSQCSDDTSETEPRRRYEEMFTSAGAGKYNMVDYFQDMSHGRLDLSGSQVFGWLALGKRTSDYQWSGGNPQGRQDLIDCAPKAAADSGIYLAPYFS